MPSQRRSAGGRLKATTIAVAALFGLATVTLGAQNRLAVAGTPAAEGATAGIKDTRASSLPEDEPLPRPHRVLVAADARDLTAAIAAAKPGDHITLADGVYGDFTISADFPRSRRLVVRAQTPLAARFTSLTIAGSGIVVDGVSIDTGSLSAPAALTITGREVRVTRFRSRNGESAIRLEGAVDALIDRCELSHYSWRGVFADGETRRPIVSRCWVHSGVINPTGRDLLSAVALGNVWPDRFAPVGAIVRFNYFERLAKGDYIHLKSSDNTIAFNVFVKTSRSNEVANRNGLRNVFAGNSAVDMNMVLADYDGLALGNRAGRIDIRAGNSSRFTDAQATSCATWDCESASAAIQYASRRARAGGNLGPVVVGRAFPKWCAQEPTPSADVQIYQSPPPTVHAGTCDGFTWVENLTDRYDEPVPPDWYRGQWWAADGFPRPASFAPDATGPGAP